MALFDNQTQLDLAKIIEPSVISRKGRFKGRLKDGQYYPSNDIHIKISCHDKLNGAVGKLYYISISNNSIVSIELIWPGSKKKRYIVYNWHSWNLSITDEPIFYPTEIQNTNIPCFDKFKQLLQPKDYIILSISGEVILGKIENINDMYIEVFDFFKKKIRKKKRHTLRSLVPTATNHSDILKLDDGCIDMDGVETFAAHIMLTTD